MAFLKWKAQFSPSLLTSLNSSLVMLPHFYHAINMLLSLLFVEYTRHIPKVNLFCGSLIFRILFFHISALLTPSFLYLCSNLIFSMQQILTPLNQILYPPSQKIWCSIFPLFFCNNIYLLKHFIYYMFLFIISLLPL